jgi:hypothetical protein
MLTKEASESRGAFRCFLRQHDKFFFFYTKMLQATILVASTT